MRNRRFNPHKLRFCEPVCVECGGLGRMVSGEQAYPHRRENWAKVYYQCPCGALVGCHPGTAVPAGRPASTETRALRFKAHEVFDRRWGRGERSPVGYGHARQRAYRWLQALMNLTKDEAHIGNFTAEQCQILIAACENEEATT